VPEPDLDPILQRARQHDPAALQSLVDRYAGRVYGLLYRLTGRPDAAEELVQETFLRVVRTIEQYEHAGRFEAWLFRIAANLARDRFRKRKRRGETVSLDQTPHPGTPRVDELAGDSRDPAQQVVAAEERARLEAALQRLNDPEREILLLRHHGELSFREIAELLDIPLGTALARAHRALKRLRAELGQED
jgi:RNA polymerase sigma-70 factor (ECF subfamily)